MTVWSILPLLPLLLCAPLAMMVAKRLHRKRRAWSRARLAALSALPGAVIVLLLGWYLLLKVRPASPEEIDSGGMIIAALMTVTPLYALLVVIIGMISARAVLRPR